MKAIFSAGKLPEVCLCCLTEGSSPKGLKCIKGHVMCQTPCTEMFIKSELQARNRPILCPICHAKYATSEINRCFSQPQLAEYDLLLSKAGSEANDIRFTCLNSRCGSERFLNKRVDPTKPFIAPCTACKTVNCVDCRTNFSSLSAATHRDHVQPCKQIIAVKLEMKEAIEKGAANRCPCGHTVGHKDGNCTHMGCTRCHKTWCYVCEQYVTNGSHNDFFYASQLPQTATIVNNGFSCVAARMVMSNHTAAERGCPRQLRDIRQRYPQWPADENACIERYHKYKTLKMLKPVYLKHGVALFTKAWLASPYARQQGVSMLEIDTFEDKGLYHF